MRSQARSERGRRIGRRIERPPVHWSLLALLLGGLLVVLVANGLATGLTGSSGTPTAPTGRAALHSATPIWRVTDDGLHPVEIPLRGRVALTFDDGPDPTWTPRIAAVLKQLGVPATFFVVGDRVVRHPGVVDELLEDGFELGTHTFTHANLAQIDGWQRRLQVALSESAVAGAAGVRPRAFRPPYSSTPNAVTAAERAAVIDALEPGQIVVYSNLDSEDWRRPGVETIVRSATPRGRRGGVILMHDGGDERAQTLAALRELVPRLQDRGFRFVSLAELLDSFPSQVEPAVSGSEQARGRLLIDALTAARWLVDLLFALLIPVAALALVRAVLVAAFARRHARAGEGTGPGAQFAPSVSIIVPAYNESAGIERAVSSLAGGDYPAHEVIVVDDGSTDGTGELVTELGLSGVRVLRQPNSGKAAALNAGLAVARGEVVVSVDADTIFEPETIRRLVEPFADPSVGAAAGNAKVGNRRGLLGRWQHIEYVIGFNLDRRLYDVLQCMPTVPGAVGAFRRAAIEQAGGFSSATLAEDTDLTIAIGRAGWRVVFVDDARGWTEAPASLSGLWRQRYRWCYGTMQALWKHRSAFWRREPGKVGRRGFPYLLLFQVALPTLAPVIDLFAVYGLIFLDPLPVIAYWLGFTLVQLGLAVYAFRLDGESPRTLWALPLQQVVYRQLMYLVVFQSLISAVRGVHLRWQHVERTGEIDVAT